MPERQFVAIGGKLGDELGAQKKQAKIFSGVLLDHFAGVGVAAYETKFAPIMQRGGWSEMLSMKS